MADNGFWQEANRARHIAFGAGGGISAGISDQERSREFRAQAIFFPALAQFRGALHEAASLSGLMRADFAHLDDALTDHAPTRERWDEEIAREG